MPVGSHKDAFKAHQLVKKLTKGDASELAKLAAGILLDFVKNQRQINADSEIEVLPSDPLSYDTDKLDKALVAVDSLCGKCEEQHDNACFVNQARRALIAAKTGADIGSVYDGNKSLDQLLEDAETLANESGSPAAASGTTTPDTRAPATSGEDDTDIQQELEALREQDIFRSTLIDEVVETITSVTQGNFHAEMPVHEDEQLGKLATGFNMMLKTINDSMANLDQIVAERTAELKQIMNTVPVGLLSINKDFRINPEHSAIAATMLREEVIRGRDFLDLLGITRRNAKMRDAICEFLDLVRMGMLPPEDLKGLNPIDEHFLPAETNAPERWLRTQFFSLDWGDTSSDDLLVLLEDITAEKQLAAQVAASEKKNSLLLAIAKNPILFRDFLNESHTLLANARSDLGALPTDSDPSARINSMFRGIHTIKGTAGSFHLSDLSSLAGTLENFLGAARDGQEITDEFIEITRDALDALSTAIDEIASVARGILGDEINQDHGPVLRIPIEQIKTIVAQCEAQNIPGDVLHAVRGLQDIPAKDAFAKTLAMIPGLIERLEKSVRFEFTGNDTPVPIETAQTINQALVHLVRNAFDHGIETPDIRVDAGKPEEGCVSFDVSRSETDLTLTVRDDGKGLDPATLRQSAVNKGLISEAEAQALSDEEAQRLIFRPGFSTADEVTDVSGRGVGMDAVVHVIESTLGGSVRIDSTPGTGSSFVLHAPLQD